MRMSMVILVRKNVWFWSCDQKATKVKYKLWLVLNGNGANGVGFNSLLYSLFGYVLMRDLDVPRMI